MACTPNQINVANADNWTSESHLNLSVMTRKAVEDIIMTFLRRIDDEKTQSEQKLNKANVNYLHV